MPHERLDRLSTKPVLSWANHELDKRETQMAQNKDKQSGHNKISEMLRIIY